MTVVADYTEKTARRGLADVLDHVAVVSSRPAPLFDCYEKMGFTLSPETRHSGSVRPGGPTEPLGTGNRCAMFAEGGYLELLAVFDPTLHCRGFPERLERYEGLHILAFECTDASLAAAALRDGGTAVQGIGHLERSDDTPDGCTRARTSSASSVASDESQSASDQSPTASALAMFSTVHVTSIDVPACASATVVTTVGARSGFGASVTTFFGRGAASARARSMEGEENYRVNAALTFYDQVAQQAMNEE